MKTLHAYLLRQLLGTLTMTVGVCTFFILLVSVLKEVLGLLVTQQVSVGLVGRAILLLIPHVLVYALPMGLLTAALLVFGRLSADHEITAMRAGGVSLVRLATPVLGLAMVMSGLCAFITMHLGPECRIAYKNLLREVGLAKVTSLIPEKTYIRDFSGAIVYVGRAEGPYLEDVLIYELKDDKVESYTRAGSGEIIFSSTNNLVFVHLTNTYHTRFVEDRRLPQPMSLGEAEFVYTNSATRKLESRVELDNMTFVGLRRELRELERQMSAPLSLEAARTANTEEGKKAGRLKRARQQDLTYPVRLQMHRQVAFSFACIGFTLVGIPLGIRAHRRETSFGIAVALILVLVYYSFFILGASLETRSDFAPHLILWAPNFLFQVMGSALLWRANRGI
jgi:lipopolysaccharide export system permease protein